MFMQNGSSLKNQRVNSTEMTVAVNAAPETINLEEPSQTVGVENINPDHSQFDEDPSTSFIKGGTTTLGAGS